MSDDYTQEPALEDAIRQAQIKLEDRLAALRKMGASIAPGDARFEPEEMPAADLRPLGVPTIDAAFEAFSSDQGSTPITSQSVEMPWGAERSAFVDPDSDVSASESDSEVEWLDAAVQGSSSDLAWSSDAAGNSWGASYQAEHSSATWSGSSDVTSAELLERLQEELPQQFASLELTLQRSMETSTSSVSESFHDEMEQVGTRMDFAVERFGELLATNQDQLTQVVATVHDEVKRVGGQIGHAVERVAERMNETHNQLEDVVETTGAGVRDRLTKQMDLLEKRVTAALEQQHSAIEAEIRKVTSVVRDDFQAPLEAVLQLQTDVPIRFAEVERKQETLGASLHARIEPVADQVTKISEYIEEFSGRVDDVSGRVDDVSGRVDDVSGQVSQVSEQVSQVAEHVSEAAELGIHSTIIDSAQKLEDASAQITQVAATLDSDRVQRAADLEMLVDAMGSGWTGVHSAVETLLEQVSSCEARVARLEELIKQLDGIESTVASALEAMQANPVVVTVSNPLGRVSTAPLASTCDADAGVSASASN